jgi:short-chain fatty acids transporter
MISRLGLAVSRAFGRVVPDPFVIAILLTALTAALSLSWGERLPPWRQGRIAALLDAWRGGQGGDGLWSLLAFGMQMCLILVTGHALASAPPMRRAIERLARVPRSTASAAAMVGVVASAAAIVNWGMGLIVGAFLARDVGRSLYRRGIVAHYPLICAAGYMGLLVWHGGLSGSAPLTMTTPQGAAAVGLESHAGRGVPLSETLFSPLNLVVTTGLVLGVPVLLALLAPPTGQEVCASRFDVVDDTRPAADPAGRKGAAAGLDRSRAVAWLLAGALLLAAGRYAATGGLRRLDLDTVNATMLAAGLILHGSPRGYMDAVTAGARGCAGIMIQFPLYAGIMSMMRSAGLVEPLAAGFTAAGDARTIPLLTFFCAALLNLFIPSGGGQWAVQGPVSLQTGAAAGLPPGPMIMAVAYGDELTNMLQPFWALPLLGITGVRARDIVGYTTVVMVFAGAWMAAGLLALG